MNIRVERAFERTRNERPLAFIPYLMAGDPDLATTEALGGARAAGADAIELGIPYGDPLADGPTIARPPAARALASGTGITDVLAFARRRSAEARP